MSERGLVFNDDAGDGTSSILVGILEHGIDGRIKADRTGSNRMEYFSGTHLVKLLGHMIRVQNNCWVVTGHLVEGNDRGVITGNMPTMSDAPQHVEEVAVGAHGHEGQAMGAAGDMKESHHIGLQVVGRRVKSDGTRSKELVVEHLEHLKIDGW